MHCSSVSATNPLLTIPMFAFPQINDFIFVQFGIKVFRCKIKLPDINCPAIRKVPFLQSVVVKEAHQCQNAVSVMAAILPCNDIQRIT